MLHLLKRVIHLADSGNESVGSDVKEIVQWDRSLRSTKTFQTAVLILSGCKFESPNLELLQNILLMFIADHSYNYYFKRRLPQNPDCLQGWVKKCTVRFLQEEADIAFFAEHLAFLLVLWRQVEKEKEAQEASKEQSTRASSSSTGVPKTNNLKRAFRKLWPAYTKPIKL
jgi:hypothetical protein